jgi:hypothetical protein
MAALRLGLFLAGETLKVKRILKMSQETKPPVAFVVNT